MPLPLLSVTLAATVKAPVARNVRLPSLLFRLPFKVMATLVPVAVNARLPPGPVRRAVGRQIDRAAGDAQVPPC